MTPGDDLELPADALRVARQAVKRATVRDVKHALRAATNTDSPHEGLRALAAAFDYEPVPASEQDRRGRAGSPYAPLIADENGSYPPLLPGVAPELDARWASLLEQLASEAHAEARLADLLYVNRGRSAHEFGRRAAQAQAALASIDRVGSISRTTLLARAMEISAELSDRTALATYIDQAVELVDELARGEHPGPPLSMLRALLALKRRDQPAGLDNLAERVGDAMPDGHPEETAVDLAAKATTDPKRRRLLHERGLDIRLSAARASEGLARAHGLQRSVDYARAHNLVDRAEAILRELQELPTESLGFSAVTSEVSIPVDEIKAEVDAVVGSGATDLVDALDRVGRLPPPGGSDADLDAEVLKQEKDHPLLSLFGQQSFGPLTSAPTFIADTPASKRLAARGRLRRLYAEMSASALIAPMLDEGVAVHGRPGRQELIGFFATSLVGEPRAERIVRALELYWDGEPDLSAHLLVPRLESILRDLARSAGIVIVRPAEEGRFAGFQTLRPLLSELRELYASPPWLDYLDALLCDPLALNLRNDISHGLVEAVGRVHAALLLQAACHLAAMTRRAEQRAAEQSR